MPRGATATHKPKADHRASSGIGAAFARDLAGRGYDRSWWRVADPSQNMADSLKEQHGTASHHHQWT